MGNFIVVGELLRVAGVAEVVTGVVVEATVVHV